MNTTTKERPILFSGPMVRAILEGRKTQTRRLVKCLGGHRRGGRSAMCPQGVPGDRLWVRETWQTVNSESGPGIAYRADSHFMQPEFDGHDYGAGPSFNYDKYPGDYCMWYTDLVGGASVSEGYHWQPSIHMPRWASRITLVITAVRVERLNEISESDAVAEGCGSMGQAMIKSERFGTTHPGSVHQFAHTWQIIHGDKSWKANPFVWVIEFRRIES